MTRVDIDASNQKDEYCKHGIEVGIFWCRLELNDFIHGEIVTCMPQGECVSVYNARVRIDAFTKYLSALHPLSLGVCAGILAVFALRLPFGWPLVFVALIPLIYASQRAHSVVMAGIAGAITGILICGNGSWWMLDALPLPVSYGVSNAFVGYAAVIFSWCSVTLT